MDLHVRRINLLDRREAHYLAVGAEGIESCRHAHPLLTLLLQEGARPVARFSIGSTAFWIFESYQPTRTHRWSALELEVLLQGTSKEDVIELLCSKHREA